MTVANTSCDERNYDRSGVSFYRAIFQRYNFSVRFRAEKRKKKEAETSPVVTKGTSRHEDRTRAALRARRFSRGNARADLRGGCAPETSTGRNYTQ